MLWVLVALAAWAPPVYGDKPAAVGSPVAYEHELRHDPNQSLHVVRVSLADPRVTVGVSRGGPDPDGDGPWTTTLLSVREVAAREKFDVAVNGDFFSALPTKDAEGKPIGFVRGKPGTPAGPAATDGVVWQAPAKPRPALLVGKGKAAVEIFNPKKPPEWARQAVGGNVILVRDGKVVTQTDKNRHPRTVAGVDKAGTTLILLVVDGRQKDLSIGMTYEELGTEMVRLGAEAALNLDGGGSTTLVMRDPTSKELAVVNSPSDAKERAVADVLGVKVNGPLPSTRAAAK